MCMYELKCVARLVLQLRIYAKLDKLHILWKHIYYVRVTPAYPQFG